MNPIMFGLYGGLVFAGVSTTFHYLVAKEITYSGLVGGLVWLITALVVNYQKK